MLWTWHRVQVSVLFLLQLNKNFVINNFILLCNYVTKFTKTILLSICSCIISSFTIIIYIYITCFILCDHLLYFTCMSSYIVSYDHLTYFTSAITCISSWDIGECSSYLVSSYECLLISLHVRRIIIFYSRIAVVHLRLWLGLIWD